MEFGGRAVRATPRSSRAASLRPIEARVARPPPLMVAIHHEIQELPSRLVVRDMSAGQALRGASDVTVEADGEILFG